LKNGAASGLDPEALPDPPRPGLTSVPANPKIPEGFYRACGYPVCGPRAVRMDIIEAWAGMTRPAGDAMAVSMGSGFDMEAFFNGGPGELPVGVTIQGDPDAIGGVGDNLESLDADGTGGAENQHACGHAPILDHPRRRTAAGDTGPTCGRGVPLCCSENYYRSSDI